MKVLSLFDGMACGMISMILSDVKVEKYVAYEIDKYAVQTSSHNFPMIEHKGDVFQADFKEYEGFDFLVGGSPCTYWSIAQTKNRETTASGLGWELFSQYVRALREAKPKYFIYENNKSMSAAIRQSITETFGFEPICINSALVSAQNRQRLYWVGKRQADGTYRKVKVNQPEDRGILLPDILKTRGYELMGNDKAYVLTASYDGAVAWNTIERHQRTMVAEPVIVAERGRYDENGNVFQHYEANEEGKSNALTTVQKDNQVAEPIRVGTMPSPDGSLRGGQAMRVYSTEGKAVTLKGQGGGSRASAVAEPIGCIQTEQLGNLRIDVPKSCTVMTIESHGWTNQTKTAVIEALPECFRVKEATKQGYTEIEVGQCVDMSMPNSKTRRGRKMEDKSNCLQTSCEFYQYCGTVTTPIYEVKDGMITVKGKQYPIKLVDGFYIIRKLTVRECMRLQTVPEWYDFSCVSKSQAYKMLGNGWTCEVIKHLIQSCLNDTEEVEYSMDNQMNIFDFIEDNE